MAQFRPPPPTAIHVRNGDSSALGRITLAATGVRQQVALLQPRKFGQYAMVYILSGRGTYADAKSARRTIGAGDLILVFPEVAHLYNPLPGTTWVTSYLCFQGPVFDLWCRDNLLSPRRPILHAEPVTTWSRRLGEVIDAARQSGPSAPLLAVCRLQQLLSEIVSGAGRPQAFQQEARWLDTVCGLIEARLGDTPDWPQLARQVGLSAESLRKRFTHLAGQPPARYRRKRLIDRACELMQGGAMKDREIAESLGFCDEFYFSRRFKAVTGKSPRHFRREGLLA